MSGENKIPKGWVETTLGEVAYFVNDKIPTAKVDLSNYISTENLLPNKGGVAISNALPTVLNVNHFKPADTLFSNIRTYFKKVWYADKEGGASNDVLIFRPKKNKKIDSKFLFYHISSDRFINFTVITAKGTKMPRGDKSAIITSKILIPQDILEQQAIATILTTFDNKIELLQAQNQTLEATAQTIFKEWFGKYQIGDELPEGWRVGKLGEIANLRSGYAFKSKDFVEESNYKALKIKDLKGNGEVSISDISCVDKETTTIERVKYFKLSEGDIVLAMSGNTTGKIGVVPPHETNIYLNQRVGKFFLHDRKMNSYLYNFLMSDDYESKILSMGYGSAQPNINPTQIAEIDIVFPDETRIKEYLDISNPVFDKVLKNNSQIQTLQQTRDTLLPKLMSGKLRVDEFKD